MKTRNLWWGAAAVLAAGLGAADSAPAAELGAKDEPIKLAMLEWTGQHVSTHIAGQLLQKMGYKVEYVTAGNFPEFSGLSDGTLSASVEVWMNNVGDIFPKVLAEKKIEDVGPLKLKTAEGWIYPKYMEQVCPGLPDWTALTPVPAGSEGALVAELESAVAAKKPLVMMFWAPHYALAEADVGWVKMPPCKIKDNAHCIEPPDVDKIVWSGFAKKWPAAYEFLKQFTVDASDQQKMMLAVDKKGEDLDKVTKAWIDQHPEVWQPWIKAAQS